MPIAREARPDNPLVSGSDAPCLLCWPAGIIAQADSGQLLGMANGYVADGRGRFCFALADPVQPLFFPGPGAHRTGPDDEPGWSAPPMAGYLGIDTGAGTGRYTWMGRADKYPVSS